MTNHAPPTAFFHDLPNEAAHGHLCVRCLADFTATGVPAVPVGRSATTGETVKACATLCAAAVLREQDAGQIRDRLIEVLHVTRLPNHGHPTCPRLADAIIDGVLPLHEQQVLARQAAEQ